MEVKHFIKVPTRNLDGTWTYTIFNTREDFREYVKSLFKEPGKYAFDETVQYFNKHAQKFNKDKLFCEAPENSKDFIEYWDTEKEKCRKGVIIKGKDKEWYLPRYYYHWLNFLRIYNKVKKSFEFPDIRDVQYHMALYEMLAPLHDKNVAVLKKRQIASSYFHVAKIYNRYIFEDGFVGKILASDKKFIDATNGNWKFLAEYHNFTNEYTAWIRHNSPEKVFSWQQKVETKTLDGRKVHKGTKATISGITLDKDPIAGVGGASDEVFFEEGGIAPLANVTYGYMRDAMREGAITTGLFCIAGSVGDLEQCEPLKEFILHPEENDFYPVQTNLLDKHGTEGISALFLPEQWSMPPYIDEHGNSLVEEALKYLDAHYKELSLKLRPDDYQLRVSQGPRNIEEAFAIRKQSIFKVKYTAAQIKRIEDKEYYLRYTDLERTDKNEIILKKTTRVPNEYPQSRVKEDKRGCVVIHELPIKGAASFTYLYSIDSIRDGKSKTSDSLATIYIWKNAIEVEKEDEEGKVINFTEGNKIVAFWTGRYDDINETNELMSMLIEFYNAWGICENNEGSFINYMQSKKRYKYLATVEEMLFDKEMDVKQNVFQKYGWRNTPGLWKKILAYGIDSLSEEIDDVKDENGVIKKLIYGVERIVDIGLLKEMQQYSDTGNYDRVVAYCALIAFVKIQETRRSKLKRVERKTENLVDAKDYRTLQQAMSPFRHIGRDSGYGMKQHSRPNPFKNFK